MSKKGDLLGLYLSESAVYKSYKDLESLIQDNQSLKGVPPLPLYFTLKQESSDQLVETLRHMSGYQKQILRDLENWKKDDFNIAKFDEWCLSFFKTGDQKVIAEFVQTYDFLLYLKGRFNIYTFDLENPVYPEHDNFFVTDDDSFLFEFSGEYKYPEELKFLVKSLYGRLGVEKTNQLLMGLVSETFSVMQETAYEEKVDRLRDVGYVDYYEAIELSKALQDNQLEKFIKSKLSKTLNFIERDFKGKNIHYSKAVSSFHHGFESIYDELNKISNPEKVNILLFDFSRLVNAQLVLGGAFDDQEVDFLLIGDRCKQRVKLAIQEIRKNYPELPEGESIFEHFSFLDLYKVGHSLLVGKFDYLDKSLTKSGLIGNKKYFLGDHWNIFLEDIEDGSFKLKKEGKIFTIEDSTSYMEYVEKINLLVNSLPIILQFKEALFRFKAGRKKFAYNFDWDDVDFESLLLTQFIRFFYKKEMDDGFLVEVDEFLDFVKNVYGNCEELEKEFLQKYSLDMINNFSNYLSTILFENFEFLKEESLSKINPKFLSGVILSPPKK